MNRAGAGERCTTEVDRGGATVWAAGAIAVLVLLMMYGVSMGAAVAGRHRAEAAADLAALAAAGHALDGESAACAYGDRVVEAMAGRMLTCRIVGWEAFVEVEVRAPVSWLPSSAAHGRAHAGPVTE